MTGQQSHLLQLKYCYTCCIYRPKRAVHCSLCDACVEQMDHHCPFISTCVGRRNYIWFFAFICSLWLNSLFVVIVTAIDLDRRIGLVGSDAHKQVPLAIPVLVLSVAAWILLTLLVRFHLKMKSTNENTFDHHKKTFA